MRIASIVQEVPGVATYELEFIDPTIAQRYCFAPGQFNMIYLPGFGESAISISSAPGEALLHTVRLAGNVTGALARKRVGEELAIRGPFGTAWPVDTCRGMDLVIAAGGVGLAPLRPVVRQVVRNRTDFGRVFLLYGARTPQDLLYSREFEAWRGAGIELEVTVDLGDAAWAGHIGVVPMLFNRLRLQADRTHVFTCGPEIMMRFVVLEALARQIPPRQIFVSLERNMSCAMGLCGHCQLGPAFVCKDGPVFDYPTIKPYMHLEDL